jgi:hypothetical protein
MQSKEIMPSMAGWSGFLFTFFVWFLGGAPAALAFVFVAPLFGWGVRESELPLWVAVAASVFALGLIVASEGRRREQLERRVLALEYALKNRDGQ